MGEQYLNPFENEGKDAIGRFLFPYKGQSSRHINLIVARSNLECVSDELYHIMVRMNHESDRHISVFREDVSYYLKRIKRDLEVMGHVVSLGENSLFQNVK